jgi:hypothetical protein
MQAPQCQACGAASPTTGLTCPGVCGGNQVRDSKGRANLWMAG